MSKSIKKSLLLPGSFFKDRWRAKLDIIATEKRHNTIYFYDHKVNPVDKNLPVYTQFDAISKVLDYNANLRLGTLVTNITRYDKDSICASINNCLSIGSGFDLGIGIGDDIYEDNSSDNDLQTNAKIDYILNNFVFDKNNLSIFIGGASEYVKDLARKYNLGLNLWNRDSKYVEKVFKVLGEKDNGRNSFTVHKDFTETTIVPPSYCEEVIFVVKDSSFNEFIKQLDIIKGWKES